MGKCMASWTLIDDPTTGERVTIEECVRRKIPRVYGLSHEGRVRPTAISHWVESGIQPCYRVQTRLGRNVDVTGHHPFLTVQGWQPLHDLQVGQHIAVPTAVPAFGDDESWSLEQVRLLAHAIIEQSSQETIPANVWTWSKKYLFIHCSKVSAISTEQGVRKHSDSIYHHSRSQAIYNMHSLVLALFRCLTPTSNRDGVLLSIMSRAYKDINKRSGRSRLLAIKLLQALMTERSIGMKFSLSSLPVSIRCMI